MFRTFTAAAILVLTAATAQAQESVPVGFSDLNLSNAGDMQVLAGRVEAAAETVCGAPIRGHEAFVLFYRQEHQSCVNILSRNAMENARAVADGSTKLASK